MLADRIQFYYTVVTGLLIIVATVMSLRRATKTFNHRRPVFWLRFASSALLGLTFAAAFVDRYLARFVMFDMPANSTVYLLEVSLFLMVCSYIATAKLDQFEVEQAKAVVAAVNGAEETSE